MPPEPLVKIEGLEAINGPASISTHLVDLTAAPDYEGIWVPWKFAKSGSLEISGTISTLSCQLYGSNADSPLNSYRITIAGTVTADDVVTLNINTPTTTYSFAYTVLVADTATTIAAGLVALIMADVPTRQAGFHASNVAGLITLTWPSVTPPSSSAPSSTSSPTPAPFVTITSAVSGAATETVAVAVGLGGSTIGAAITALGITQLTVQARWLKLRVTTLTGGSISAIAQGTA